ncbi:MAG TPA: hypothetical protein VJX67_07385 [Blastocatellia bacterium]|nr:hypothetical protein [Blastocatellia bacterium]
MASHSLIEDSCSPAMGARVMARIAQSRGYALVLAVCVVQGVCALQVMPSTHAEPRPAPYTGATQQSKDSMVPIDNVGRIEKRLRLMSSIPLTVRALSQFDSGCDDWKTPAAAQELITSLRRDLRELIVLTLKSDPDQNAETLRQAILGQLSAIGVGVDGGDVDQSPSEAECRQSFGTILGIDTTQPNGDANLIAVTVSLSVACGEDVSLYLFERSGDRWRVTVAQESKGYDDPLSSQGQLQYIVSPRDSNGHYFVVSADINPYCVSNWQELRYRASRPGIAGGTADVIISGTSGISLGGSDSPFTLTASVDSFQLKYEDQFHNDLGILVRDHVLTYRVSGNHARRASPIALKPEDFVDEWLTMPWALAAQWSDGGIQATPGEWHERLQPAKGVESTSLGEVEFVHSCPEVDVWQIGMEVWNPEQYAYPLPDKIYFTVKKKDGAFRMRAAGPVEDGTCQ